MEKDLNKKQKIINYIKDDKLKPCLPTLRNKKRFIKIKINSDKKFNIKEISNILIEETIFYLGAIDFSKSGFWILQNKFDFNTQELIIKINIKYKEKLIGILSLISKFSDKKIKIEIIKVSGTIKSCNK